MPLSLEQIADAITASADEFDRAFLQTQVEVEPLPDNRRGVYDIKPDGDKRQLILEALRFAHDKGWLDVLRNQLIVDGLENGTLTQDRLATARGADLQAITDVAAGFDHPGLFYKRFGAAMGWTVRVLVDNNAVGTGVLVGPHLVLTAWHVVKTLFERHGDEWTALQLSRLDPKRACRLRVEFDNHMTEVDGVVTPNQSLCVDATQNWCVAYSPAHDDELQNRLPGELSDLNGFWDYAVIRLKEAPGLRRRWAEIRRQHVVPASKSKILLMQHPDGSPMRFAENVIADAVGFKDFVPSLRFVHLANSLPGSSGGPCFDRQFALFGIHQGIWPHAIDKGLSFSNRGVPLSRIAAHIESEFNGLPPLDLSEQPIYSLGPMKCYAPVVGCDGFVALMWRVAAANSVRVILIDGAPKTGKTFRTEVLAACLPDASHLKVVLDATSFSKETVDRIATTIAAKSGATVPSFEKPDEFGATLGTWIAKDVWPKLAATLDSARGERTVWLVFQNLDKSALEGAGANDLLLAAGDAAVTTAPWLRVVLDGYRNILPERVEMAVHREAVSLPEEADVKQYLMRAIGKFVPPEEFGVDIAAAGVYRQMRKVPRDQKLPKMVEEILDAVNDYAQKVGLTVLEGAST